MARRKGSGAGRRLLTECDAFEGVQLELSVPVAPWKQLVVVIASGRVSVYEQSQLAAPGPKGWKRGGVR